jgi:hypothetical protein
METIVSEKENADRVRRGYLVSVCSVFPMVSRSLSDRMNLQDLDDWPDHVDPAEIVSHLRDHHDP